MTTITYSVNVARRESNRGGARYVHYCRIALPSLFDSGAELRAAEIAKAFPAPKFQCSLEKHHTVTYSTIIREQT